MSYQNKYLKYKKKYLDLKTHLGGSIRVLPGYERPTDQICTICQEEISDDLEEEEYYKCKYCSEVCMHIECYNKLPPNNKFRNNCPVCAHQNWIDIPLPTPRQIQPIQPIQPIQQETTLQLYNGSVNSLAHYRTQGGEDRIVSGGEDYNVNNSYVVRIWNSTTGACIRTLVGHTHKVLSVAVEEGGDHRIISGSGDRTIKIWNSNDGTCIRTLVGHTDWLSSVAVYGTNIVSGSGDRTIKIWDLNTGALLHTLAGHTREVRTVAHYRTHGGEDRIVSGSEDRTIKIWNPNDGSCLRTLNGHTNIVISVAVHQDRIVSGSFDNTIKIWNPNDGTCIRTLNGHTNWVTSVRVYGTNIVSGSLDRDIKIWDSNTGVCLETLRCERHRSPGALVVYGTGTGHNIVSGSKNTDIGFRHSRLRTITIHTTNV
jgi:WD40 repeat protein